MKKLYSLLFALFIFSDSYATAITPITGPDVICAGTSATLSDTWLYGFWGSGNTAIATIGMYTGIITGIAPGIDTIRYTASAGYTTYVVTVNGPVVISGASNIVVGDSISFVDTPSGGTWTSSSSTIASVDSVTGIVLGISVGTTVITYTLADGCYATEEITTFDTVPPIGGPPAICLGDSISFTDSESGGVWSSSDTLVATVDSFMGMVTSIATGTAIITYQIAVGIYSTMEVTVNASPAVITGVVAMLVGDSVSLSDTSSGGTWSSSNTAIATADSAGFVLGISAGTAYISYTIADGCPTAGEITVYDSLPAITGLSTICTGSQVAFTDTVGGGTWSSSDSAVAMIDSAGIVTGISAGTATITYTIDTSYVTQTVTVNLSPAAINTIGWVCYQNTYPQGYATLTDSTIGGVWSSNLPDTGMIDSTGILRMGPDFFPSTSWCDTVIITYTVANGCTASLPTQVCICEGGISTIPNTNEITIFPNPATTSLTIQSTIEPITQVSISNILGQTVHLQAAPANCQLLTVDVSGLAAGVYFVRVNGAAVRKFVKE